MRNEIIIALMSLVGTCIGSLGGILAANKLTNYRIEQLEKKVEKHNQVIDRVYKLEQRDAVVEEEIKAVVEEAHAKGVIVKVIFETSQLDDAQIRKATEVCIAAGADFVKTSTGFNGGGATVEAVKAMLETAQGRIKVKPSGGIRNFETAKMYVDMGVDRLGIGYSSCKPIVEGGTSTEAY